MTIHDLAEYEILDEHRVEDVQSDGFILRHKKSGALVPVSDDGKNCLYRAIDVRKFAGVED